MVFQLGSLKALGPNGFSAKFYQHMWPSIGQDIVSFVQDFLFLINKGSLTIINKTFYKMSVTIDLSVYIKLYIRL